MQWTILNDPDQINTIKNAAGYSIIFKHSTRCSVSLMAKKRFELDWDLIPSGTAFYFLDLLSHRDLSVKITETFQVHHESPQALLIKDGDCILDASHSDISAEEMAELIN
ncbi:MAG: bacillithiol system redox-active protein YtxJ [Bacteroidota bacterium]